MLADPALEARARTLSQELRCMVCQNQSIDDSDAPLARDLRVLVRERLKAGDSDAQVIDFLVARYGEFVLLKPRFNAHTLLLWLVPFGVLGMVGVRLRRGGPTRKDPFSRRAEIERGRRGAARRPREGLAAIEFGEIVRREPPLSIFHFSDHARRAARGARAANAEFVLPAQRARELGADLGLAFAHREVAPDTAACLGRMAIVLRHRIAARSNYLHVPRLRTPPHRSHRRRPASPTIACAASTISRPIFPITPLPTRIAQDVGHCVVGQCGCGRRPAIGDLPPEQPEHIAVRLDSLVEAFQHRYIVMHARRDSSRLPRQRTRFPCHHSG